MSSSAHALNEIFRYIQTQCGSPQTKSAYQDWIFRYFLFHNQVHPKKLGEPEVSSFLRFLAEEKKVSTNSLLQAKQAIAFLYREVLNQPLDALSFSIKLPPNVPPVILSRKEIVLLFRQLTGLQRLMASLAYGCGLKLSECLNLRVRDLDFDQKAIFIRDSLGAEDHSTIMPEGVYKILWKKVAVMELQHESRMLQYPHGVVLPPSIEKATPEAAQQLAWQFLFPSDKPIEGPDRHRLKIAHLSKSYMQKGIRRAAKSSNLKKPVSCRVLRQSFTAHLLEDGYSLSVLQKLLGYKTVHAIRQFSQNFDQQHLRVRSPLDNLKVMDSTFGV